VVVRDLDQILSEVVSVGTRLGALNRGLEQHVDGRRDASLRLLDHGARRGLDTQLLAAREGGAFDALDKTLVQTLDALVAAGEVPRAADSALRDQLARLRQSFTAVSAALRDVAPPIIVAEAQSTEYQAFAQSLREMALLEASMQRVAEAGQQVLHRLSNGRAELAVSG
jgi:hypothetical protein